jgi:hypothetical protein
MTVGTKDVPDPGSPEAVKLGCTCPIDDNQNEEGITTSEPITIFWVNGKCKLHGPETTGDDHVVCL